MTMAPPHAVGEGFQFEEGALYGSRGYADAKELFPRYLPPLFLRGCIHLVNGNHRAVFNGLGLYLFHLHLDKVRCAPFMGPGSPEHGNHIGFHLVLRYNPFGTGNMAASFSMITTKTGTHFYTIQQFSHPFCKLLLFLLSTKEA
jgi:hypothetical protein